MTNRRTDTPAEAFARKLVKPLFIALALLVVFLIGVTMAEGRTPDTPEATPLPATTPAAPREATPLPAVESAKPEAKPEAPADSDAVAMLKLAYWQMPAASRKQTRDVWATVAGDPTLERVMAKSFADNSTAFPVTTEEALTFLRWTAGQK